MRFSVYLCQRKSWNKHLRFSIHVFTCFVHPSSSCEELCVVFLSCQDISGFTQINNNKKIPWKTKTHSHPSHSQTSRLRTSSLSLGVPVPRGTQCTWDVQISHLEFLVFHRTDTHIQVLSLTLTFSIHDKQPLQIVSSPGGTCWVFILELYGVFYSS